MVDRRIRYLNPNGKIPPPGGGNQLLQELKPPALSDLQKERLPAVQPLAIEEPAVGAGMERAPVTREKKAVVVKEVQNTTPEATALSAGQTETLEQGDPQEGVSLSESDGRNGVASHTGGVVLVWGLTNDHLYHAEKLWQRFEKDIGEAHASERNKYS